MTRSGVEPRLWAETSPIHAGMGCRAVAMLLTSAPPRSCQRNGAAPDSPCHWPVDGGRCPPTAPPFMEGTPTCQGWKLWQRPQLRAMLRKEVHPRKHWQVGRMVFWPPLVGTLPQSTVSAFASLETGEWPGWWGGTRCFGHLSLATSEFISTPNSLSQHTAHANF